MQPVLDADHQQLGVEDEHKGQDRGADVVGEALDAGADRVALRDCGRCKGGEADRWRVVGKNPEIEHEQVHRDQRHDQTLFGAQGDDHRRHQGGHHDVVGGGRQAHAEQQADHGGEHQDQRQVAAGDEFHELGHHQADAGQGDGADHDAGGGGGHTDADHVARTVGQASQQVIEAFGEAVLAVSALAEEAFQAALGEQHEHHEHGRPEGRQAGRQALHGQRPDQHHHRQQKVVTGARGFFQVRQFVDLVAGVQLGHAAGILHQADVGDHQQG